MSHYEDLEEHIWRRTEDFQNGADFVEFANWLRAQATAIKKVAHQIEWDTDD